MLEGALIPTSALQYSGDSPVSYALLKGWDINVGTWTTAQKTEFTKWSNNQPEEAGFGSYNRPRPKAVIEGEAFGPGPDSMYKGSYDGVGDSVLWPVDHGPPLEARVDWDGKEQVDEIVAQHDARIASDPDWYANKIKASNYDQYDVSTPGTSQASKKYPWGRYESDAGSEVVPSSPFEGPASEFQGTNASSEYQGGAASDYRDINSIIEGSRPASDFSQRPSEWADDQHAAEPYNVQEPTQIADGADARPWYKKAIGKPKIIRTIIKGTFGQQTRGRRL